jgi:hypothetical protein
MADLNRLKSVPNYTASVFAKIFTILSVEMMMAFHGRNGLFWVSIIQLSFGDRKRFCEYLNCIIWHCFEPIEVSHGLST